MQYIPNIKKVPGTDRWECRGDIRTKLGVRSVAGTGNNPAAAYCACRISAQLIESSDERAVTMQPLKQQ